METSDVMKDAVGTINRWRFARWTDSVPEGACKGFFPLNALGELEQNQSRGYKTFFHAQLN